MGIFSNLFNRKNKNEIQNNIVSTNPKSDICYTDSKGVKVDITFGNVVEKNGKLLQTVYVDYEDPNSPKNKDEVSILGGQEYLMEPYNLYVDEKGNKSSQTKDYLEYLKENRPDLLNAFLDQKDINDQRSNYIGKINEYKGSFIRSRDVDFESAYVNEIKNKEANKMSSFRESLQKHNRDLNDIPENLSVKTCHAQDLSELKNVR